MKNNGENVADKETELGRLYALRAGLSVVAQEKAKADEIVQNGNENLKRTTDAANDCVATAEETEAEAYKKHGDERRELERLDKEKIKPVKAVFTILFSVILFAAMLGGLYFLFCAVAQLIMHGIIYDPKETLPGLWEDVIGWLDWEWFIFTIPAGLIATGGPGFLFGLMMVSLNNGVQARKAIPKQEARVADCDRKIQNAKESVSEMKRQRKADIAAAERELEEAKQKATEHALAGLVVIDGLSNAFSDMIDVRDWENIDIIIYAIETRRALNIREALSVVDNERRTERIVKAIDDAGQEISRSINMGLNKLQGEMKRCFGILSDQITTQSKLIANEMQGLREGISINNAYVAELTSQANMNNALLASASKNSAELAQDVEKLRTATEYLSARSVYHGY